MPPAPFDHLPYTVPDAPIRLLGRATGVQTTTVALQDANSARHSTNNDEPFPTLTNGTNYRIILGAVLGFFAVFLLGLGVYLYVRRKSQSQDQRRRTLHVVADEGEFRPVHLPPAGHPEDHVTVEHWRPSFNSSRKELRWLAKYPAFLRRASDIRLKDFNDEDNDPILNSKMDVERATQLVYLPRPSDVEGALRQTTPTPAEEAKDDIKYDYPPPPPPQRHFSTLSGSSIDTLARSAAEDDSLYVNVPRDSLRFVPGQPLPLDFETSDPRESNSLLPTGSDNLSSYGDMTQTGLSALYKRALRDEEQERMYHERARELEQEGDLGQGANVTRARTSASSTSQATSNTEEHVMSEESDESTISSFSRLMLRLRMPMALPSIEEGSPLFTESIWDRFRRNSGYSILSYNNSTRSPHSRKSLKSFSSHRSASNARKSATLSIGSSSAHPSPESPPPVPPINTLMNLRAQTSPSAFRPPSPFNEEDEGPMPRTDSPEPIPAPWVEEDKTIMPSSTQEPEVRKTSKPRPLPIPTGSPLGQAAEPKPLETPPMLTPPGTQELEHQTSQKKAKFVLTPELSVYAPSQPSHSSPFQSSPSQSAPATHYSPADTTTSSSSLPLHQIEAFPSPPHKNQTEPSFSHLRLSHTFPPPLPLSQTQNQNQTQNEAFSSLQQTPTQKAFSVPAPPHRHHQTQAFPPLPPSARARPLPLRPLPQIPPAPSSSTSSTYPLVPTSTSTHPEPITPPATRPASSPRPTSPLALRSPSSPRPPPSPRPTSPPAPITPRSPRSLHLPPIPRSPPPLPPLPLTNSPPMQYASMLGRSPRRQPRVLDGAGAGHRRIESNIDAFEESFNGPGSFVSAGHRPTQSS
ncbi:hypothetical protein M422DRAFT_66022 [Sphaerobolus stellatus SS14]|nr:hypothetical protein M422DRAFT_66022 [Sphaerobolus stellatus SS14]